MFRKSREILTNLTVAVALLASLDAVVRQDKSVAHAALMALNAESGIVHAQGTIPDPETPIPQITPTIDYTATLAVETPVIIPEETITVTPTIDVSDPLTPTVQPIETITPAPAVMDVLSLQVTDADGNPIEGVSVRGLRTNPVLSVNSKTDSAGTFDIVSQIPGAETLSIGTVGENEAQSVDFSFQTTQLAYESAILELADPDLSAQLVISFITNPDTALAAFQPQFNLEITGTANIEDHSLAIAEQPPQGLSVQIDDFETNGSVKLQRSEAIVAANQEGGQSAGSEVVIFASAEDADGFSVTINGNQTVKVPNTTFSAGTLSFQPDRDYNPQTGQLSVFIDTDSDGADDQKAALPVEGDVRNRQTYLPLMMTAE